MPHATTCNVQRATCVYCNFIKCKIVTAKIATTTTARTVVHNAYSVAIRAENYYGLQSDPSLSLPLQLPLFVSPTPSAWLNRLQFMTGSCQLWFALWSARGCGVWSVECRVWRLCGRWLPVVAGTPCHLQLQLLPHPLENSCNTIGE